jgi:hypothetical protein
MLLSRYFPSANRTTLPPSTKTNMEHFIVLRVQREDNPANKDEGVVKFFPVKTADGSDLTIPAQSEETALAVAVARLPALRLFLAVENVESYNATVARVLAKRIQRELEKTVPGNKSPNPGWRGGPDGRANFLRELRGKRPGSEPEKAGETV